MRLLADENIPLASVERLRAEGHDVAVVLGGSGGSGDEAVLRRAREEDRILLTFDLDFGELVFHRGFSIPPGVILFRLHPARPNEPAELLVSISQRPEIQLANQFTVVTQDQVRQRPLPRETPRGLTPR